MLAMCNTGSSIYFMNKSIVSTLHLKGRKASLSVAGIHGSQYVKTEIVLIAVSAIDKSQPMTILQFKAHEKVKLGDQIVDLQGWKYQYPHLRNFPSQSFNLNEVRVIHRQDCYDMHHSLEIKKSDDKTAQWAVNLKIGWALSCPLPAKQVENLATKANSLSENTLASQLSKKWDIEFHPLKLCCHRSFEG